MWDWIRQNVGLVAIAAAAVCAVALVVGVPRALAEIIFPFRLMEAAARGIEIALGIIRKGSRKCYTKSKKKIQ